MYLSFRLSMFDNFLVFSCSFLQGIGYLGSEVLVAVTLRATVYTAIPPLIHYFDRFLEEFTDKPLYRTL